jgi:hypothetical protein
MSSRSVALVNTLSPDVDNANTAYHAAREIAVNAVYGVTILILCLCCHLGNDFSASPDRLLGGSRPLVIMVLSLDLITCPTNSVKYSIGHLGEHSGPSLRPSSSRALLLWSRSLHDQERYSSAVETIS